MNSIKCDAIVVNNAHAVLFRLRQVGLCLSRSVIDLTDAESDADSTEEDDQESQDSRQQDGSLELESADDDDPLNGQTFEMSGGADDKSPPGTDDNSDGGDDSAASDDSEAEDDGTAADPDLTTGEITMPLSMQVLCSLS